MGFVEIDQDVPGLDISNELGWVEIHVECNYLPMKRLQVMDDVYVESENHIDRHRFVLMRMGYCESSVAARFEKIW